MSRLASNKSEAVRMLPAPVGFTGGLDELFEKHIEPILPPRNSVMRFHEWMCQYADTGPEPESDRIFPVRAVGGTTRREIAETADGTGIAPPDNSPAWVVHALLTATDGEHPCELKTWDDFHRLMTHDIATHMFDVGKCVAWSANSLEWYVAHVFCAKNGDTAWRDWTRQEVVRRFFRTLHPCNLFFVPARDNRQLGERPDVITFMAARLALHYGPDLWNGFVERAPGQVDISGTGPLTQATVGGKVRRQPVRLMTGAPAVRTREPEGGSESTPPAVADAVKARFKASRLRSDGP